MNEKDRNELLLLVDKLRAKMKELGLVKIAEGAKHKQVSTASIYELIQRQRISSIDILGTTYVSTVEMDNMIPQKRGPK